MDRGRPADLARDGRARARLRARAPRRAAGQRDHLYAQPRGSLRRRARRGERRGDRRARHPRDRARGFHGGGDQREHAGRHHDGPARRVHVRPALGARAARARRHRSRQGARLRQRRHRGTHRDRGTHRRGTRDRRRALRVPVHAGLGGSCGVHVLFAGAEGLLRRRDRLAHPAQPLHAARCEGARCAEVERLHRRGDASVRRCAGVFRQPPLAAVGRGAHHGFPAEAARHLSLYP
jgi:hypothetical protein